MSGERWPLWCHGPCWFRVRGYGVWYVDHRVNPPLFSERYGYRRHFLHIGPYCFGWLSPCSVRPMNPVLYPMGRR